MWWSGRNKPEKAISTIKMPNGANWYSFKQKPKNLPKSFDPLSFPFLEEENERKELIRRLTVETKFAPIFEATVTGTGFTIPPSTSTLSL